MVSDGVNFMQTMLATQLNPLIESGRLGKNVVFTVKSSAVNALQNKQLVYCLDSSAIVF